MTVKTVEGIYGGKRQWGRRAVTLLAFGGIAS